MTKHQIPNLKHKFFCASTYNKENLNQVLVLVLRFGFCFYILLGPLGRAPRNIGSIIAMIGVIGYYLTGYKNSNLKRLGRIKWVYFIFIAFLLFKVFDNINISNGWYAFSTNIYGAFSLIFAGLEFIRTSKDTKLLIILFTIACFYEGLDGIYQYFTGFDIIQGDPVLGGPTGIRLTGSFSTFRVGNYLSLTLPISLAAYYFLPQKWPEHLKWIFMAALLTPGTFLLAGSQTRSGYLGFFVAAVAILVLLRKISWKGLLGCAGILAGALLFIKRTSLDLIMQDGRIQELWPYAWKVFESAPILGVGLGSYNAGVHHLGLKFHFHTQTIQHPHNIYLQFLCEMGIIGLAILLVFFFSYMIWSLRHILESAKNQSLQWKYTIYFWSAFLGYMATAFSGHDFFRTWWLGIAFSILGIILGCSVVLRDDTFSSHLRSNKK